MKRRRKHDAPVPQQHPPIQSVWSPEDAEKVWRDFERHAAEAIALTKEDIEKFLLPHRSPTGQTEQTRSPAPSGEEDVGKQPDLSSREAAKAIHPATLSKQMAGHAQHDSDSVFTSCRRAAVGDPARAPEHARPCTVTDLFTRSRLR